MSPLTVIAMACLASVTYLTAAASAYKAKQMSGRGRPALIALAVVIVVIAVAIVATNFTREVVLGFTIGGILTPMITDQLSRRGANSGR